MLPVVFGRVFEQREVERARFFNDAFVVVDLSDWALGLGEKEQISLEEELDLVHAYVSVEQIRFGARLKFEEQTEQGARESLIPPLLLQPLIENAIRHGVASLSEGGWVRLEIKNDPPEKLSIQVQNNFDCEAPRKQGAGIGLKNVRERLEFRVFVHQGRTLDESSCSNPAIR